MESSVDSIRHTILSSFHVEVEGNDEPTEENEENDGPSKENEETRTSGVNAASEQVKAVAKDENEKTNKPTEELVGDQHMTFIGSPLLQVLYTI